jgi:hypothetical protein
MLKTYHLANAVSPEDFRIVYEEQLNNYNSTVQALVIANIADEFSENMEMHMILISILQICRIC